jgi:hypothetical protein
MKAHERLCAFMNDLYDRSWWKVIERSWRIVKWIKFAMLINKSDMFELNYMNCFNETQKQQSKGSVKRKIKILINKTKQHKK